MVERRWLEPVAVTLGCFGVIVATVWELGCCFLWIRERGGAGVFLFSVKVKERIRGWLLKVKERAEDRDGCGAFFCFLLCSSDVVVVGFQTERWDRVESGFRGFMWEGKTWKKECCLSPLSCMFTPLLSLFSYLFVGGC